MKPLISVVMPVYNCSAYVGEAINSILNQTFSDFEFIIVDDCSTDDSLSIIRSFASLDKRIKVVCNKRNLGVTKSLNVGLSHARGTYIARMDADDIAVVDRFKLQVELLRSYDIVGGWIQFMSQSGKRLSVREYSADVSSRIKYESPLAHPTVMFKRSLFDAYGGYDERFNAAEDYDLWLRYYTKGALFGMVSQVVLYYRVHDKQIKVVDTKKTIRRTLAMKRHASRVYGFRFGFVGRVRMLLERGLLLLPGH